MCAGARFTYLPGRTRRRAAASRPRSQRRRARRRRPREPSGQTRRPRVRSRQHAQGDGRDGGTRRARLACSKTLCRPPSAAESWFRPSGGDSNEIASRRGGRCFADLLPYPWYGHVPRVHVASIGCADHAGEQSCRAVEASAVCVGPAIQRRRWSGPAARGSPWRERAPRAAVLSPLADVTDSW